MGHHDALREVLAHAERFLDELPDRPVGVSASTDELRAALNAPLPTDGMDDLSVVAELMKSAEPGLMATAGPRFFGFVIGGATPVSIAADWLASVWDQNTGLYVSSPALALIEEVTGRWLIELLSLPAGSSIGFVTGGQMANFTGLAAGRDHVLAAHGWDVEADGLQGAPPVTVIAGEERHVTIDRALRYLGLGPARTVLVPADDQGRMIAGDLRSALAEVSGPAIVCAQAGNVNTGAFDPIGEISDIAHETRAWVHVDGAFGLWAAASPRLGHLLAGHERADSWATDAHKWLNVPYDCGVAFTAHPTAHLAAMGIKASYLVAGDERDNMDWTPEASRRARALPVYASIRALGRAGIAEMIERCCANARRFADQLSEEADIEVLNDVVLNQVLVRFDDDDDKTRRVIDNVQRDGTCWLGGSVWQDRSVMRISVSNWSTTAEDVDRSVEAILRARTS